MAGAVAFAVAMVLVVPMAVMFGGALWSGVFGWISSEDAHARGTHQPTTDDAAADH